MLLAIVSSSIALAGVSDDRDTVKNVPWMQLDLKGGVYLNANFWGICIADECRAWGDITNLNGEQIYPKQVDKKDSLVAMSAMAFVTVTMYAVLVAAKLCLPSRRKLLDLAGIGAGLLAFTFTLASWALAATDDWALAATDDYQIKWQVQFKSYDVGWGFGFGAAVSSWLSVTLCLGLSALAFFLPPAASEGSSSGVGRSGAL